MQHLTNQQYAHLTNQHAPKSPIGKDCLFAFLIGGAICTLGQAILDGLGMLGLTKEEAGTAASIVLVFLSAILTGFHLYDKLGKVAGAGSLVPITGFANSVVSPALEFKSEGVILGLGAKMFTIAGPVIVFGLGASVLYGFVYWLCTVVF